MSIVHSPAAPVHSADSYADFVACCSDLGHMASDAEYELWADSLFPDVYPDEAPELTDDMMFDDGPIFEPTQDDLDWLASQRHACRDMPETLAALESDIEAMKARMTLKPISGGAPEGSRADRIEAEIIDALDGGSSAEGVELVKRLHELTTRLIRDYGLAD